MEHSISKSGRICIVVTALIVAHLQSGCAAVAVGGYVYHRNNNPVSLAEQKCEAMGYKEKTRAFHNCMKRLLEESSGK